jgi:hypothetical protein
MGNIRDSLEQTFPSVNTECKALNYLKVNSIYLKIRLTLKHLLCLKRDKTFVETHASSTRDMERSILFQHKWTSDSINPALVFE